MTDDRQAAIESVTRLQDEAQALLETAQDETMKNHVRLALRDIDDAYALLQHDRTEDQRPWQLAAAQCSAGLATARLRLAKWALDTYGPGVGLHRL